MCGRFLIWEMSEVREYFRLEEDQAKDLKSRYNAAPGQDLPIITRDKKNLLSIMRWGLIPSWSKDPKIGYKMINARAESVFNKLTWEESMRQRRCLVPTNGFYEWKREGDAKQPYYIGLKERSLFAFAGLYSSWTNKTTGEILDTFTIITTSPNNEMSKIHDRMPVILHREAENEWLNPKRRIEEDLLEFLLPYDDNSLKIFPVSEDVNNVRNDYKELVHQMPV